MRISLLKKEPVAEKTMAFTFSKPDGFVFKAGQSADLTLVGVPVTDSFGNSRSFSIASAPHEPELLFTMRMRDTGFKNVLRDLPLGTEVVLDGPFGPFFLHENAKRPAVFIAGGIGITPFRSMILDALERKLPHKITLFSSNREPKDAAFLTEITQLFAGRGDTFVPVMSGTEGHIGKDLIVKHVSLDDSPVFYLAGPPKMVFALRDVLNSMGVSNDDIRFEEFAGY